MTNAKLPSLELLSLDIENFKSHLLQRKPIIDVRAPVEFKSGSIPGSVNLPILDDEERALIGTCFKVRGQDAAIALGYQIVSGENKLAKQKKWADFIQANPNTIVTCYRGGQRSQISQKFLLEMGIEVSRIEKGYKQIRQFFLDTLDDYATHQKMILLTGLTGSAKTKLLSQAQGIYPTIDLEDLAKHRGSAFGHMPEPQPAQADFENRLAAEVLRIKETKDLRPYLFEDESRLIGRVHLPESFFENLRRSPVIVVQRSLEERIDHIFQDYIVEARPSEKLFAGYEYAMAKIEKRLGGLKAKEIMTDLQRSKIDFLEKGEVISNRVWIEKLLVFYYDRLYTSSFEKRAPKILFQGNHSEVLDFLRSLNKPRAE